MYCPHCGAFNADEARFCTNCGRPLAPMAVPPPAYPDAPAAIPRPTGAAGSIRIFGLIVLGLSILIILGFFLMNWAGDRIVVSGWDIFNELVLRDVGRYFNELGDISQAVTGGYASWTFLAWYITIGLLWLAPLSALITGIYGLSFIAMPQTVRRVRAKVLEIVVALIVLGALLGFTTAIAGQMGVPLRLADLGYGFWVTLGGSAALFFLGLVGVALVPPQQR